MYHPNIYPDGTVCISILHPPGDDPNMYEDASERWSPVQSVEKILLSVVSMLAGNIIFVLSAKRDGDRLSTDAIIIPFDVEPNDESGAHVEASKMWRSDRTRFNEIVKQTVLASLGL